MRWFLLSRIIRPILDILSCFCSCFFHQSYQVFSGFAMDGTRKVKNRVSKAEPSENLPFVRDDMDAPFQTWQNSVLRKKFSFDQMVGDWSASGIACQKGKWKYSLFVYRLFTLVLIAIVLFFGFWLQLCTFSAVQPGISVMSKAPTHTLPLLVTDYRKYLSPDILYTPYK